MGGHRMQPAVELVRMDVDSLKQRLAVEVERERHHGDRAQGSELRWKVRSRVGDDGDRLLAHSSTGFISIGSSRRRFFRLRKKRSSIGLRPTSITSTIKVVNTASRK